MKKLLLLFIGLWSYFSCYAQQDAQYTQYMYNTVGVNPAYAGTRGHFTGILLHRSQWVGLEGAPQTQTFSIHSPLRNEKIGLGLSAINDKLGPTKELYVNIDFSYILPVTQNGKLSFGLKAGGNFLNVDYDLLKKTSSDAKLEGALNRFLPNIGAGIYYYTDKFYAGVSVPNILESSHYDAEINAVAKERKNYYAIMGYVFQLDDNIKFKPSVLAKAVSGAPLQLDFSGNFLLYDRLTIGGAYRWSAAFSGMLGYQISDHIMIGYAYDSEVTDLADYNSGSHEAFLRFELFSKPGGIVSPRFF